MAKPRVEVLTAACPYAYTPCGSSPSRHALTAT